MIDNEFLAKLSGFFIFYRWHPAIALRYLPIVDEIKKIKNAENILEVGSAGLGITPYLKKEVTGIDIDFKPPFHTFLKRINGSAIKLPFVNGSFDIVISMDMLEHLKKTDREKAISEMIRVASKTVYIGVPSGNEAAKQDKLLRKHYKDKFGDQYQFFEEQINEGLPEKKEIYRMIINGAKYFKKKVNVEIVGNENMTLHKILMKGWMTKNLLVDIFFRKILLFAIPLIRLMNYPPYYRQLFFVEIKYENSN